MCQPVAEMIGDACRENLCLILQPPEGMAMNDAIAVALEFVPVRMLRLRILAAPRLINREAQAPGCGHFEFGISDSKVMALPLMFARGLFRKGSRSLRARAGSDFMINSAKAMVACSLDTRMVG